MTKPFIKWVGGKSQIIDKIMDSFPKKMGNYFEPFLGGGSVLIKLLEYIKEGKIEITDKIFASDFNEALIYTYINIKNDPDKFIRKMRRLKAKMENLKNIDKPAFYYEQRDIYNSIKNKRKFKCSVLFVFLNKTCFRGMYRTGPNGFNVPYGNYSSPEIIDEENIRAVSALIQNVIFTHISYEKLVFPHNCFVYFDPPYYPINETSFVKYNASGFDEEEHKKLFGLIKGMNNEWVMSNSKTSFVLDNFKNFHTVVINCKRRINSKNPASTSDEVIISNLYNIEERMG